MKRAVLIACIVLASCGKDSIESTGGELATASGVKVTGELQSANSHFFGPPAIPDIWNYTIAFMAPDGRQVKEGMPILRFDPQELMNKLLDMTSALGSPLFHRSL